MARHGESKHFKRSVVTRAIVIPRKKYKYYIRQMPGKHRVSESVALSGLIRDLAKIANNAKESRFLIKKGYVKIDEKSVKEEKYSVGFGDVVDIRGEKFLVSLDKNGRLALIKDDLGNGIKKLKVISKSKFKGGKTLLSFNDGRNMILNEDNVQVGDSVLLNLLVNKIEKVLPFEQGAQVIVFRGKNAGLTGKIANMGEDSIELQVDGEIIRAASRSCFVL
ncbi:MAG: hypothetical protein M1348_00260 [Candidatus Parvarchaeota archaeon]|jgi:small subunit ribosomal protein S4e|nr:hypothetical protein [Candidatus Parvarchaeota archaeon]MCL5101031.1 hypothetical protein [Candidatus Parvarchaeota archaeon]